MFFWWCYVSHFFVYMHFQWFCIDVCTFGGAVTSSNLFEMALVEKDFHLNVDVSVTTSWIVASLVPGTAHNMVFMQLHHLKSVSMRTVGSSVANIAKDPRRAVLVKLSGSSRLLGSSFLLLWLGGSSSRGIPLSSRFYVFVLKVAAEPGYWSRVHSELTQCLPLLALVSEKWVCVDLSWNWGLVLWDSLQWLRLYRRGVH